MLKKLSELNFTNRSINLFPFLYEKVRPTPLLNPKLIHTNSLVQNLLNLAPSEFEKQSTLDFLNGNLDFEGIEYRSSYYSGHQFGHFVPRLGDGRAIKIGEIKNENGDFFELQFKGSGLTPFSRMGDGKAVLRSSIREYLASAHLKALNVPTTMALSLIAGDDKVYREEVESSAMILRVAESFLRFGHFEFFYFHREFEKLKNLVDGTIELYFNGYSNHPNKYHLFFQDVVKRTAKLMAKWQAVGFCHGVMNTDNMSILGLTIDYGPFGFLEKFDLDFICNHSDYEGRYSFGNQPEIAKWNLEKLAIALSPFIDETNAKNILNTFEAIFNIEYQRLLREKLGLTTVHPQDEELIRFMLKMLYETKMDYTNFFRQLVDFKINQEINDHLPNSLKEFLMKYNLRLINESSQDEERANRLRNINPKFVLRNYLAQMCLEDEKLIPVLFKVLSEPFLEWDEFDDWKNPAPEKYQFLCVSCSS